MASVSTDFDYSAICFVVMPFGQKPVGEEKVDFDHIYESIFVPAIGGVEIPERPGVHLVPRRTDRDFFSGDIGFEMFNYLEYSRFVLADISGLNANVFYELGHRHRARESGTAIFRQTAAPIPFDIAQIKAFPYEYSPEEQAEESRSLIRKVLTASMQHNRPDSPVRRALAHQRAQGENVGVLLREAENALRHDDTATAIAKYRQAVAADPQNPLVLLKEGLLLKDRGEWQRALDCFRRAVAADPGYGDAHREKGIAENKLFRKTGEGDDGEAALREAVRLNPEDFDAWASLGGVLKRAEDLAGALEAYETSTRVSKGHSYPLLNMIKLRAAIDGELDIDAKTEFHLRRAETSRLAQATRKPPYDAPWSHFDSAEIRLYLGDPDGFLELLDAGLLKCQHGWQPETFRDSLALLTQAGIDLPGLEAGIEQLEAAAEVLE